MAELAFNIPQIITVLLISYFAVRWLRSSTTSDSSASRSQTHISQAQQIQTLFPQYDLRTILWDLQRNGGSVQATSERILQDRGLDTPPPSFQPQIPPPSAPPVSTSSSTNTSKMPDLITRYNLSSKLNDKGKGNADSVATGSLAAASRGIHGSAQDASASTWSQDKSQRAEMLKKKRDEMILAARRAMVEKDRLGT